MSNLANCFSYVTKLDYWFSDQTLNDFHNLKYCSTCKLVLGNEHTKLQLVKIISIALKKYKHTQPTWLEGLDLSVSRLLFAFLLPTEASKTVCQNKRVRLNGPSGKCLFFASKSYNHHKKCFQNYSLSGEHGRTTWEWFGAELAMQSSYYRKVTGMIGSPLKYRYVFKTESISTKSDDDFLKLLIKPNLLKTMLRPNQSD